jgi:hypothetical protein
MSNLAVHVAVNGANGTGLAVSIYPQSNFVYQPQRGNPPPNATATATGTTDGSGNVTLTGLSAVAYQLMVVDARGVNNWFGVPAGYVGGSYTAIIPWSTPTAVTKSVSTGGDTPGRTPDNPSNPFPLRSHFHELGSSALNPMESLGSGTTGVTPGTTAQVCSVELNLAGGKWVIFAWAEVTGGTTDGIRATLDISTSNSAVVGSVGEDTLRQPLITGAVPQIQKLNIVSEIVSPGAGTIYYLVLTNIASTDTMTASAGTGGLTTAMVAIKVQ